MGLLEWIIGIFKPNKAYLPPGKNTARYDDELSEWRNGIACNTVPLDKEPTLEEIFREFIGRYSELTQEQASMADIYKIFISLFRTDEDEIGNNLENQENLIEEARKKGFSTFPQRDGDHISFYHLYGKKVDDYRYEKNPKSEKLYLNCERKNIALITRKIIDKYCSLYGNTDELAIKFNAEQLLNTGRVEERKRNIKNYQRFDKIVIFTKGHQDSLQIAEMINELRNENPELFSGRKFVPIVPKLYGFIGCAPYNGYFENKENFELLASGKTYNNFIADLIFNCSLKAFDAISAEKYTDPKIRMWYHLIKFDFLPKEDQEMIIHNFESDFLERCKAYKIPTSYLSQDVVQEKAK